jgi:hypothetical protein
MQDHIATDPIFSQHSDDASDATDVGGIRPEMMHGELSRGVIRR